MRQRESYRLIFVFRIFLFLIALTFGLLAVLILLIFVKECGAYDNYVLSEISFEKVFSAFICFLFAYYLFQRANKQIFIEYDNSFLYIVNENIILKKKEEKVDLRQVIKFKRQILSPGDRKPFWIIKYITSNGTERKVNTIFYEEAFTKFQDIVNRKRLEV